MRKWLCIWAGVLLLVALVLNPSMGDFKESSPTWQQLVREYPKPESDALVSIKEENISYQREKNYLVCSVYRMDYTIYVKTETKYDGTQRDAKSMTRHYLGVAKNFFRLSD